MIYLAKIIGYIMQKQWDILGKLYDILTKIVVYIIKTMGNIGQNLWDILSKTMAVN